MSIRTNYKYTIYSCYFGYIVQGIINNISPILFATYIRVLGVSVDKIGLLIVLNFGVQILVDFAAAKYVDKIGYRKSMIFAHIISVLGIMGIGVLPNSLPVPFAGLVIATIMNGIGGGLLEVMVSPIAEAAPGDQKEQTMSMLHSFYCWGCVGFILISTILLQFLGDGSWFVLPLVWAAVPLINVFAFCVVPINVLAEADERIPLRELSKQKTFWILVVLMLCAGASELSMAQWASYFAEIGLGVSKAVGDLLGPCAFSFFMALSRVFYGKKGGSIKLERFMQLSCVLCIGAYLLAVFAPTDILSLIGCAVCGLSVGILWPGTFSIAAAKCRAGGTALFAFLALAGDVGCMSGPALVGAVSGTEYGLKAGLLTAVIFPVIMLCFIRFIRTDK